MGWQTDNFKDLGERGFVGCSNDRLLRSLEVATGSTGTLNDLWHKYWDTLFVPGGSFNDRMFYYLTTYASIDATGLSSALNSDRGIYIPAGEYFTDLSAAGGMYYSVPGITLGNSFEIECYIYTDNVSNNTNFYSFRQNSNEYLQLVNSGGWKIGTNGKTPGQGSAILENVLTKTNLIWDESQFHLYINDVLEYSVTPSSSAWISDPFQTVRIGSNHDATLFNNGIIRNIKIWTGGDRTTGTLARFYPLNEATGTTIFDLSGNGQNGSTVNITDNERELYRLNSNGDWLNIDNVTVIEVA